MEQRCAAGAMQRIAGAGKRQLVSKNRGGGPRATEVETEVVSDRAPPRRRESLLSSARWGCQHVAIQVILLHKLQTSLRASNTGEVTQVSLVSFGRSFRSVRADRGRNPLALTGGHGLGPFHGAGGALPAPFVKQLLEHCRRAVPATPIKSREERRVGQIEGRG